MRQTLLALALLLSTALQARAEIVFFTSGRTLSVKSYTANGTDVTLTLRSGGEMTCEASLIARIEPDEVADPVPVEPTPVAAATAAATRAPLPADPRFDGWIKTAAAQHGVDAELVRAVIQVESAYEPKARSAKGAVGLMQVLPATARQYGVRNLYDPRSNIDVGIRHLKSLLERFPLALALAAYNAGAAAVDRFGGVPPYRETEQYVARILALVGS